MKIRILNITLLFVFMSCSIHAQQEKPVRFHQVGVNFNSLNSFGIHYKTGSKTTLLRFTLLSLDMANESHLGRPQDSIDLKSQNYGAGLRIGFERHVPVVAKFDFIWGLEAGCSYNYQKQWQNVGYGNNDYESKQWRLSPTIYMILGARYTIADHLVIGAEIMPGFYYSYGKTTTTTNVMTIVQTNSMFNFNFTNNSANLSLAYRFSK